MLTTSVRIIGKELVESKLAMAGARISAMNEAMVTQMLDEVKSTLVAETPLGPGHFGYHLRDRYVVSVKTMGLKTKGVLKAPSQGFWREYGTKGHYKGKTKVRRYMSAFGGGGEPAGMFAHKALAIAKRVIKFYYGGLAKWYRA